MDKKAVYKNNPLLKAFENNKNIEDELDTLMILTLSGIYYGLGEKNFYRWVNRARISEGLKKAIVKYFSEKEREENPNTSGFYVVGKNEIRLDTKNENTLRHELLHLLTDFMRYNGKYATFLNEGFTEYLNREIEKIVLGQENVKYTYSINVNLVEFLHRVMGDGIIKSYLRRKDSKI